MLWGAFMGVFLLRCGMLNGNAGPLQLDIYICLVGLCHRTYQSCVCLAESWLWTMILEVIIEDLSFFYFFIEFRYKYATKQVPFCTYGLIILLPAS